VVDPESLPPEQRVALAYTPEPARSILGDLLAFDTRLGRLVGKTREPMLGQMRLAWWREQLALSPSERAKGDPLLEAIGERWVGEEAALIELVDGWEQLLGEAPLEQSVIADFAAGRSAAFGAFARLAGHSDSGALTSAAARRWALADFARHASNDRERERTFALLSGTPAPAAVLPRLLRGIALLDVLTRRAVEEGRAPMTRRSDALLAMRLGLFGR
jgi:phytoene synthase